MNCEMIDARLENLLFFSITFRNVLVSSLAFIFFIAGIYFLYAGPNTGIFFQLDLGILVGIGLGGTAISIPMAVVGKHFPLSNRTIAMSIVTAVGSFGYFISPLFTSYSLKAFGWHDTLLFFIFAFILIGFILIIFILFALN